MTAKPMTLAQVHHPTTPIPSGELDMYLAKGWFRMGQTIFTTHILHYDNAFYSAVWLRIPLEQLEESNTSKKLKKLNQNFRTVIQPAIVNKEKEVLFERYKRSVSFEAAASVEHLLFGKHPELAVYNTFEICLYDGDTLIAAGFFDLGDESAAGISSFYDPDYKKYSLGKYLIYQKIEYCQRIGMRYFYPGYFVPGYTVFDYKLDIAKPALEFFSLPEKEWLPIADFSLRYAPLEDMRYRLELLLERMNAYQIPVHLFHYEFYNANLTPEFKGLSLFDFPVFLYCFELSEARINPILVYDLRDKHYHLIQCESLFKTDTPLVAEENYAAHLLKTWKYLYSTDNAEEMARQLLLWKNAIEKGRVRRSRGEKE